MKKLVIVGGLVLLLAGGGAGGWWYWTQRAEAADAAEAGQAGDEAKARKKSAPHETAAVPLDPFLVNLADPNGSRFLRVTLQLVIDDPKLAAALTAKGGHGGSGTHDLEKVRLRSAVLELLTTQTADRLVTPDGKDELKKAIAARASGVLGEAEVVDVLFTDFVVQF